MKRLIINADDFGATRGVNRAVIECHAAGTLTSATLLANGAAYDEAVALAHSVPTLGVGAHLNLTAGRPLLPPEAVPSLVDETGRFHTRGRLMQRAMLGRVNSTEVARELRAQVGRLRHSGVRLTHLDSHQHAHAVPAIFPVVLALAREYHLPLRLPAEQMIWRETTEVVTTSVLQRACSNDFSRSPHSKTTEVVTTNFLMDLLKELVVTTSVVKELVVTTSVVKELVVTTSVVHHPQERLKSLLQMSSSLRSLFTLRFWKKVALRWSTRQQRRALATDGVPTTDAFLSIFGLFPRTRPSVAAYQALLAHVDDGITELMVHPGYADAALAAFWTGGWPAAQDREAELRALLDPAFREHIQALGIQLVNFLDCRPYVRSRKLCAPENMPGIEPRPPLRSE